MERVCQWGCTGGSLPPWVSGLLLPAQPPSLGGKKATTEGPGYSLKKRDSFFPGQEVERPSIILERVLSVPPADCTQESGWWNGIAHDHSSAKQLLFPPSPAENTLATHTNFTNKKAGSRGKKRFLRNSSSFFPLFLPSPPTRGPAHISSFFLHFRGCGISVQVELGREGGSLGAQVPEALLRPETTRNLDLKGLSHPPGKHTLIQSYWLKPVPNSIFSAPSHFPA